VALLFLTSSIAEEPDSDRYLTDSDLAIFNDGGADGTASDLPSSQMPDR